MPSFDVVDGISYLVSERKESVYEEIHSFTVTYNENTKEYNIPIMITTYRNKLGSFIFEFLYTDFNDNTKFMEFFNKYGLSCFLSFLDDFTINIFNSNRIMKKEDYEVLILGIKNQISNKLVDIQKQLSNMLEFCLFKEDSNLKDIGPMYRLIMLKNDLKYKKDYSYIFVKELKKLYSTISFDSKTGKFLPDTSETMSENSILLYEDYRSRNIGAILNLMVYNLLSYEIDVYKCETCGRCFLSDSKKAKYCNYPAINSPNKLCSVVSREQTYNANLEANPLEKEYRKIYKKKENLCSRNKDIPSYREDFEKFKIEGKMQRQQWKKGNISDCEFKKWLSKHIITK